MPVSSLKAAPKELETCAEGVRSICLAALTIAAEGGRADIVKPLQGIGSGVFEMALPVRAMHFAWSTLYSLPTKRHRNARSI